EVRLGAGGRGARCCVEARVVEHGGERHAVRRGDVRVGRRVAEEREGAAGRPARRPGAARATRRPGAAGRSARRRLALRLLAGQALVALLLLADDALEVGLDRAQLLLRVTDALQRRVLAPLDAPGEPLLLLDEALDLGLALDGGLLGLLLGAHVLVGEPLELGHGLADRRQPRLEVAGRGLGVLQLGERACPDAGCRRRHRVPVDELLGALGARDQADRRAGARAAQLLARHLRDVLARTVDLARTVCELPADLGLLDLRVREPLRAGPGRALRSEERRV